MLQWPRSPHGYFRLGSCQRRILVLLTRLFPDKPQVCGNRTSIQPPREPHFLGSHPTARLFRFDRFRKAIRSIFSSCRHTSPVVLTCRLCPRTTLELGWWPVSAKLYAYDRFSRFLGRRGGAGDGGPSASLLDAPRGREKRPEGRRCEAPGRRRAPLVMLQHHGATRS